MFLLVKHVPYSEIFEISLNESFEEWIKVLEIFWHHFLQENLRVAWSPRKGSMGVSSRPHHVPDLVWIETQFDNHQLCATDFQTLAPFCFTASLYESMVYWVTRKFYVPSLNGFLPLRSHGNTYFQHTPMLDDHLQLFSWNSSLMDGSPLQLCFVRACTRYFTFVVSYQIFTFIFLYGKHECACLQLNKLLHMKSLLPRSKTTNSSSRHKNCGQLCQAWESKLIKTRFFINFQRDVYLYRLIETDYNRISSSIHRWKIHEMKRVWQLVVDGKKLRFEIDYGHVLLHNQSADFIKRFWKGVVEVMWVESIRNKIL